MKLFLYIANIRLPTERAHGLQIMKTCEALAREGVQVELIVPRRSNRLAGDPFAFYNVEKNFTITTLPSWDIVTGNWLGALGFWLQSYTFYRSLKKYLRTRRADAYYTRDLPLATWLTADAQPLFYEIHTLPDRSAARHRNVWEKCRGLVVISDGLKNDLVRQGIAAGKILVARDAVDTVQFAMRSGQQECRKQLGIPAGQRTVVYTGHLYEWKGAGIVAQAAALLPLDIHIYIVGGTAPEVEQFRQAYRGANVHIIGWQPHDQMPLWNEAADIVVLPTSGKQKIGALYTSPLKLFEYLASGTPIVAAALPSVREILADNQAIFFKPDDPADLARALQATFADIEAWRAAAKLVTAQTAKKYSWSARARQIIAFISSI